MKTYIIILGGAALVCSLNGCISGHTNTVENANPVAERAMISDKRVITDTGLYGRVRVLGVNTAVVSTGFLKIQVEVQNLKKDAHTFAYHIDWFDQNSMIINTPTASWIDRQIQGGETLSITAVAPMESAKDFRIKFIPR